jgi:hypothetical protein
METRLDDKVAQYLVGGSHATLDQVCRGIGIQFPSSHQHQELAIAMENAGWHHVAPCYGSVSLWEAGPKSLNRSPSVSGLLGIPEA